MTPSKDIQRLIDIMAALRTPVTGCPWDLEQTFATIAPYTIEEAYEVADAIERGDLVELKDELGDLLLQVVYHSRMAEEQGAFSFGDVVEGSTKKMIRRHPHVFGDETARTAGAVNGLWDRIKAEEKKEKSEARTTESMAAPHTLPAPPPLSAPPPNPLPAKVRGEGIPSLLDDVPIALPGLTRAIKLQHKAAKVGFDWPSLAPVFDKMREELTELEEVVMLADPRSPSPHSKWGEGRGEGRQQTPEQVAAPHPNPLPAEVRREGTAVSGRYSFVVASDTPPSRRPDATEVAIKEEFGDLLFVMANVARHLNIDPEAALRAANEKFTRRFHHIEARLRQQGSSPEQSTLGEMDALWDEAKAREKGA